MGFGVIDPTLNSDGVSPLLLNMRAAIGNTFGLGKALNQMGTLRSTIGATNAQNNAIQKTAMPLALGHVTMQDLLNHRMAINNQYLPEQLKSHIGLSNAQADTLRFNMAHPFLAHDPYLSFLFGLRPQGYANAPEAQLAEQRSTQNNASHTPVAPTKLGVPFAVQDNRQPATQPNSFFTPAPEVAFKLGELTPNQAQQVAQQQVAAHSGSTTTPTAQAMPTTLGGSLVNPVQYIKSQLLQKILPKGNGLMGEWQTAQAYKNLFGENDPRTQAAKRTYETDADYKNMRGGYYRGNNMTPQGRLEYVATAQGMGIYPMEAAKYISEGVSLKELAKQRGVSLQDVKPIYPATTGAVTQIQNRRSAVAEVNSLSPFITAGLAPYARTFAGYSLAQIADAFSKNPADIDKQARFLAAKILSAEQTAARIRALAGQAGVELMKEVQKQAYGQLKILRSQVSPEVATRSQGYVDQQINKAFGRGSATVLQPLGQQQKQAQQGAQVSQQFNMQIKIPTFNSKAEFLKWVQGLSSEQRQQVWNQLR